MTIVEKAQMLLRRLETGEDRDHFWVWTQKGEALAISGEELLGAIVKTTEEKDAVQSRLEDMIYEKTIASTKKGKKTSPIEKEEDQ